MGESLRGRLLERPVVGRRVRASELEQFRPPHREPFPVAVADDALFEVAEEARRVVVRDDRFRAVDDVFAVVAGAHEPVGEVDTLVVRSSTEFLVEARHRPVGVVVDGGVALDIQQEGTRTVAEVVPALEAVVERPRLGEDAPTDGDDVLRGVCAPVRRDEILGEVMAYCEEQDANLYVVSDHGFAPIEKIISVNRILADAGLLTAKDADGTRGALSQVGLNKDRVMGTLKRLGVTDDKLVQTLPKSVVDFFGERIPGSHGLYDVNFERTDAFLHGLGSVYVNDTQRFERGTVPPSAVERTKDEVVRVLEAATDPETGDSLLTVSDGDDLFPNDPDAPDVVVEAKDGYHVKPRLGETSVEPAKDIAAYHRPEGIFFAWGDDVRAGTRVEDAAVVDVAPTVLHSMGREVPEVADGSVLSDVFAPESEPATTAVETARYAKRDGAAANEADTETVEDRLRGLGYME